MGVTEIKYDQAEKVCHVSVKLFTNDLEDALRKTSGKQVDVLNPKNKAELDTMLSHYIKDRLQIAINAKNVTLSYIGHEKEEEALWTYFEIKKITSPKKIVVTDKLLYDYLPQQTNIVHAEINGLRKSSKVTNPDNFLEFTW